MFHLNLLRCEWGVGWECKINGLAERAGWMEKRGRWVKAMWFAMGLNMMPRWIMSGQSSIKMWSTLGHAVILPGEIVYEMVRKVVWGWWLVRVQKAVILGKSISSATGNRTPVSRVTGGDTSHYTIADKSLIFDFHDFILHYKHSTINLFNSSQPTTPLTRENNRSIFFQLLISGPIYPCFHHIFTVIKKRGPRQNKKPGSLSHNGQMVYWNLTETLLSPNFNIMVHGQICNGSISWGQLPLYLHQKQFSTRDNVGVDEHNYCQPLHYIHI